MISNSNFQVKRLKIRV